MSEENEPGNGQGDGFKPITSQDDLNRIIGERIGKVKAQYADYDALKEKASKFDQAEEASKTELQKERERAEAAERRASQAERSALQQRIAAEEGVIPEVLHGDTEEEMRAAAKKVIEWRDSGKKKAPPPKTLKSGSSRDGSDTGGSRAAAALRQLRQGG